MGRAVVLIADAGREAGLGHASRSSAVAVALRCRGIETRCYAYGAHEPFRRDGVDWTPLRSPELPESATHVLVIDSYRLPDEVLTRAATEHRLVVMHDFGGVPEGAALVVSVAATPSNDGAGLNGFAYAALRPDFWGLPPRKLGASVRRVLVTTGSGQFAALGGEVAQALAAALPESTVTVIRGPHSGGDSPAGIKTLDAPVSLLTPLLTADLVVCAAGQTMLEAAAAGTPCIALPLVENQQRQAARLAELGAVRLAEPPTADVAAATAVGLAEDAEVRSSLSREGQRAVDGYGALRVAFAIARLVGEMS